ncbi:MULTISPECIES: polyamine aminopropyltransferase [unclassified Haematospirillum]|uniref:polyamine aminopropyltransferase n=1 Tax=unclassified Haematospirillum TaxID=2622088 RepID=UPI0014398670|nr:MULTISPECIES: polyamine aminopropyltransferase [unclassified Haematospirillum]NKD54083.1 polyamine aminopropyltransferase [Haematospirillum sp. H4890]NKD74128.1 polyamine aminopropyltransferase [Haematospirillum sp. H4485]NKD87202.1 polyamine aminopropyltransferase [Haematospirillum sp. 15-248]
MTRIFSETLHRGYAQTMAIDGDMLADERSPFQHIQIFDTPSVGRVMVLDGNVQITERDEASYSEMLTHLPILETGTVKRVLIIGGGDGAVAEEALKHPDLHVDMCEIDERVIALCKTHLASVHKGIFDHPRFTLHVRDAFDFMRQDENRGCFDLIIADRPDPIGPAEVLFRTEFYELLRESLTDTGVVVFQNGVPFFQPEELSGTLVQLRRVFPHSGCYLTVTPTYVGGFMALTWGSRGMALGSAPRHAVEERFRNSKIQTDYYNADVHAAAFMLPEWIRRLTHR